VFKRLVAGVFVSVLAIVGVAPAATAVPKQHTKVVTVIDWDAPKPAAPSGPSTRAIDWD
jgi:hypothetical protein